MMDVVESQESTSMPASQGMLDSRMTTAQLSEKLKAIPTLPPRFRDLLLESKFLTWFPKNVFDVTLGGGRYTKYDQSMGWEMRGQEPLLLREFLRFDLLRLSGLPDISTHKVRTYMSEKFGISNREAMVILGIKTTAEALKEAGANARRGGPYRSTEGGKPTTSRNIRQSHGGHADEIHEVRRENRSLNIPEAAPTVSKMNQNARRATDTAKEKQGLRAK